MMKGLVSGGMAWILVFTGPVIPCQTSASDADNLVTLSNETANNLAQAAFYQFLMQSVLRASPWAGVLKSIHASEVNLIKSTDTADDVVASIRAAMNDVTIDYTRAEELVKSNNLRSDELYDDLRDYLDNYQAALVEAHLLVDQMDDQNQIAALAAAMVNSVLNDLQRMCDRGVAISFTSPNLTPLTPKWPGQLGFQIGFKIGTDQEAESGSNRSVKKDPSKDGQDGNDDVYGLELFPIMSEFGGHNGDAYNAALTYATLAASYYFLGGSLSLSTSALIAAGEAGGVTIIIAVVMLLITQAIDRNKSRDEADDVQRVFYNRANAMTVANDVRNYCRATHADLAGIPALVRTIEEEAPNSAAAQQFFNRRNAAQANAAQLISLAQAAKKKQDELAITHSGEDLNTLLANSDEVKTYNQFVKSMGDAGLMEILLVQLTDIQLAAHQSDQEIKTFRTQALAGAKGILNVLKSHRTLFEQRRDRLFAWNRLASLEVQEKNLPEKLVASQDGLLQISALAKKWQKHYFQVVTDFITVGSSSADLNSLNADLNEVSVLAAKFGQSAILDLMARRTQSILSLAGGARP